jgi:hypothetical protein
MESGSSGASLGFRAGGELRFRVEQPDALEFGAEEVQSQWFIAARRPQIHDPSADRKFARFANGAGIRIGIADQKAHQLIAVHVLTSARQKTGFGNHLARRNTLQQRVYGGDDKRGA